jgi:hypothetical protein
MCRRSRHHFFNNWLWTYNPKLAALGQPTHLPFDLFPMQAALIDFVEARIAAQEEGLVEKSRDTGFTYVMGGIALHAWIFLDGFKTAFGSRKAEYVDTLGDPDSIFEKMRLMLGALPIFLKPGGYDPGKHDKHMHLLNPENGNTIRGEAGDEMGRGGRSTLYVVDEAAFIERAERVAAGLSANADIKIWGSTVNGPGNYFAQRRHGGTMRADQIFSLHYSKDPRRTPEWVAKKKSELEPHIWASEYEIDYSASVEGICIPAAWVNAGMELGELYLAGKLAVQPDIKGVGGGDVGGSGKAKSVFVARFGPIVTNPVAWQGADTADTAHRMLDELKALRGKVTRTDGYEPYVKWLNYDSVGVGAGVQSALREHGVNELVTIGVNVGTPPSDVMWPDHKTSKEKFTNLKAELWFTCRARLQASAEHLKWLKGEEGGVEHQLVECLILPPRSVSGDAMAMAAQLSLPKWHRNERGLIFIEPKDQLARRGIPSPDHAEALVLTFAQTMSIFARM